MRLKQFRAGTTDMISPISKNDFPLFKHCTQGKECVNLQDWVLQVKPMLVIHGVTSFVAEDGEDIITKV